MEFLFCELLLLGFLGLFGFLGFLSQTGLFSSRYLFYCTFLVKAIFLIAGHGLSDNHTIDNGAAGNGTTERKEVVEIAQDLSRRLMSDVDLAGMQIIKVGVESRMSLREKIERVNTTCWRNNWTESDCILLSIHINSAASTTARGLEAWYSREEGTVDLASSLILHVSQSTGLPIRNYPIRTTDENRLGRLGIVDDTVPKGCLFETGFISNEFDAQFLKNAQLDDKIAEGFHRGLREYLALPTTDPTPTFYRDVPADAWYYDDVRLCLDEGILLMKEDGLFHPHEKASRAEVAAMFARHLRKQHGA